MPCLAKRLPRLTGLIMFEAAARHLSFTRAAEELDVTQAAVSQQIRAIETELGRPLFRRLHRGLELTRDGHRFQRSVSMALEYIASATDDFRRTGQATSIAIGVTQAVAQFWLVPRIERFRAVYPNVDVRVFATDRGFEKVAGLVNVGIRLGKSTLQNFRTIRLCEGEIFPVCSPSYLKQRRSMQRIADLIDESLLSIDDNRWGHVDWPVWFAEFGVCGYVPRRSLKISSYPLVIQAAREGQGIALGWTLSTADLIARGELVRPIDTTLKTRAEYYLVVSEEASAAPVSAFCEWVLGEFEVAQLIDA